MGKFAGKVQKRSDLFDARSSPDQQVASNPCGQSRLLWQQKTIHAFASYIRQKMEARNIKNDVGKKGRKRQPKSGTRVDTEDDRRTPQSPWTWQRLPQTYSIAKWLNWQA